MSMENPYRAPEADIRIVGIRSGRREDLKRVAQAQKVIVLCILLAFVCIISVRLMPTLLGRQIAAVIYLATILVATVFMFILAIRVYSTAVGVLMGVLTLIPCIGLLTLLRMNHKATTILRDNGIKVGLLGADMSQF
jgi:hypothetical protein